MSLRFMAIVGLLVLALGSMVLWLIPMTTSEPTSVQPIGTSMSNHGEISSANRSDSRMDRHSSADVRENMDEQRR